MTRSHASPQAGSLRLDFAYDASGLRLHKRTPRGKPARPSAALDREPPPNAVAVELRSPGGTVQYRQLVPGSRGARAMRLLAVGYGRVGPGLARFGATAEIRPDLAAARDETIRQILGPAR